MSFMVQLCTVVGVILFIIWTAIMGVYVLAFMRQKTVALIAFVLGSSGYTFAILIGLAWLKVSTIPDK
jgi:hypothetical protein